MATALPAMFWLLLIASGQGGAVQTDFYPEARALILEAESAIKNVTTLPGGGKPLTTAADLLARAGYLQDAMRVGVRAGSPPEQFAFALTVYGDLPGALRAVAGMRDPERRTTRLTDVAHLLWRMGQPENGGKALDEAEKTTNLILNPARRKFQLQVIAQERAALAGQPPIPVFATPHPIIRTAPSSAVPAFPITADGFRDQDPANTASLAAANASFLTGLYALVAMRDTEGLRIHTEHASTPFQKALGLASIEHVWIQLGNLDKAEAAAQAIPDDKGDCSLAKAEALSATAAAWARTGEVARATEAFDAALQVVASVDNDLAFGRTIVTARIAAAQAEAGMVESSGHTFEAAIKRAGQVKPRPKPVGGVYPKNYFGMHSQEVAYPDIFGIAIRARNLDAARKIVDQWPVSQAAGVDQDIAGAWLNFGYKDEAISYARALKDEASRVQSLLLIARLLLDEAGAPSF